MGSIYQPNCYSCNYNYQELYLGCGMVTPYSNIVPVPCYSCKRLTKLDVNNQEMKCSRCKKGLTPLEPFVMEEEDISIQEMKFKCPKCGEKELQFKYIGLWD